MYVCMQLFQDGLKTIEHFQAYIEELVIQLGWLNRNRMLNDERLLSFETSYVPSCPTKR